MQDLKDHKKIARRGCLGCYEPFRPDNETIKYCSDKCRKLVKWELQEARLLDTGATDQQLEQHRRNHPKYRIRRLLLGKDKIDIESYSAAMRELRQERIAAGKVEDVELDALIERDGGICHLCGTKVSPRKKFRRGEKRGDMSMYPTVDHIIPLSRGGHHTWENVKLAHLSCNARKGGRL